MAVALAVAGCKNSQERAEEHYQNGLAFIQQGQDDKGLVELRNVFKLNGDHREARALYAGTVRERGDLREAFGQYLRLVEQYPDDIEGRIALSEMAFMSNNWDEFERHSNVLLETQSEDPRAKVIRIAAEYRNAVLDEDDPRRLAVAEQAEALSGDGINSNILRRIIIENLLRSQKFSAALDNINSSLSETPDDLGLYRQKLAVLGQLRDDPGFEATLREMIDRFPKEENLEAGLIRFYLSRNNIDAAEDYLRSRVDPEDEDQANFVTLVRFLLERRSPEAAVAELNTALAEKPDDLVLRSLRAGIKFDNGERGAAIADLETLLETPNQDTKTVNSVKVALARMQLAEQNEVGARRLVEEILESDPNQVEALKMRSVWQIDADDADAAITSLRAALDQSPQDAQAMGLLARAYTRAGRHELARDYLSLAVEASGNAPAESLRYAAVLSRDERYLAAEDTLLASLRANQNNVPVLTELGRLYVAMKDIARARQVVDTLRRIDTEASLAAANGLDVSVLNEREGTEGAVNFLENLAADTGNVRAKIAIIQTRLNEGKVQEALDYATEALAETPDNALLRYAFYVSQARAGQTEQAEAGYREMLAEDPTRERIWIELIRLLAAQGRRDEIDVVIDEGLAALPEAPNLLWAAASFLERDGNIEGAIKIYNQLYETESSSVIVANNLASLLTLSRPDDAEAVERAYNVARRLRGSEVPALQDTYGWIMYLRGEYEEALANLEPAAKALSNDAMVQYHLAKTYKALQRDGEALKQFQRAVELAGEIDTRPQIEEAREAIRNQ